VSDRFLLNHIVVNQPKYNMLHRDIEREVIPVSQRNGIGQVVFSPLAQGLLTGKYASVEDVPADSRAADSRMNSFIKRDLNRDALEKVGRLTAVSDGLGIPLTRLALAWILRQPGVASALVGASRPEQIEENVKASGVALDPDTLDKIEEALR